MKSLRLRLKLPTGQVETVIESPDQPPRGVALIAHPHPLHGGTLDNKVAWTLARAALAQGHAAIRPNFRGVGASTGAFDHGEAETDDLLAMIDALAPHYPNLPWTLLGFSFGAYVQHRVAARLPAGVAQRLILVGPAVTLYAFDAPALPCHILHGAQDELIPLAAVRAYASAHGVPLTVIEDAGHFFHGRLKAVQHHAEALLA